VWKIRGHFRLINEDIDAMSASGALKECDPKTISNEYEFYAPTLREAVIKAVTKKLDSYTYNMEDMINGKFSEAIATELGL